MKLALDEKMRTAVSTKYIDYGEDVFFNPAYTLLTMSRDEIFLPRAEQNGGRDLYLFFLQKEVGTVYEYKNTEPDKELQAKAEKELPGWTMKKHFVFWKTRKRFFFSGNMPWFWTGKGCVKAGRAESLAGAV